MCCIRRYAAELRWAEVPISDWDTTGISTTRSSARDDRTGHDPRPRDQLCRPDIAGPRNVPSALWVRVVPLRSCPCPNTLPLPSKPIGPDELVAPLISLSTLAAPLLSVSSSSPTLLGPSDMEPFLQDLARRFEPDNELGSVLGPVVRKLCYHPSLFRPEGLAGGDASWRGVIGGLEALTSVKAIANMVTRLEAWCPADAQAQDIETKSLMGPLLRLGVFEREWVSDMLLPFVSNHGE